MKEAHSRERTQTTEAGRDFYLPGGPRTSTEPGLVEWFVTRLLRRRGGYRVVVREDAR